MNQIRYEKSLPTPGQLSRALKAKEFIIIYDRKLARYDFFKKWLKNYKMNIAVTAGEKLKDLSSFEKHSKKLLQMTEGYSRDEVALIAVGGGSVGDFVGFTASVLRRGVTFANIPSTWLAAIDSAHGGKTALNLSGAKNQIGTFYEAKLVWMCRELLESSGERSAQDAMGEVIKIILLVGGPVYRHLSMTIKLHSYNHWKALPFLVSAKLKIVKKDRKETSGYRQILNLGHTLGHIIEAAKGVSHGRAVLIGVLFAINWSGRKRLANSSTVMKMRGLLESQDFEVPKMTKNQIEKLLMKDKKAQANKVRFIFLKRPGQAVIRPVTKKEFLTECKRQGVLR